MAIFFSSQSSKFWHAKLFYDVRCRSVFGLFDDYFRTPGGLFRGEQTNWWFEDFSSLVFKAYDELTWNRGDCIDHLCFYFFQLNIIWIKIITTLKFTVNYLLVNVQIWGCRSSTLKNIERKRSYFFVSRENNWSSIIYLCSIIYTFVFNLVFVSCLISEICIELSVERLVCCKTLGVLFYFLLIRRGECYI